MALLVGCGSGPLPTGTFRGERSAPVRPGTDPVVAAQLRRVVLTIDPDGTATLEDGGMPYDLKATRSGDRLSLEVRAIANKNASRQFPGVPLTATFDILADGTLRSGDLVLRPSP